MKIETLIQEIGSFTGLADYAGGDSIEVKSPINQEIILSIKKDSNIEEKIFKAAACQEKYKRLSQEDRESFLRKISAQVEKNKEILSNAITLECGKMPVEAAGEVANISSTIELTIKNNGAAGLKDNEACEAVLLITSYNFPLSVAGWTIAPVLLAGGSVIWKPSEKTPITAIAFKKIFDDVAGDLKDLLQVVIGKKEEAAEIAAHGKVDMISATGSVGMGKAIRKIMQQNNKNLKPLLELGGNNGVLISNKCSDISFAVESIIKSFLPTGGQRCTNTRRVIVHKDFLEEVVGKFREKIQAFIAGGNIANPLVSTDQTYMYAPLIDEGAYKSFAEAKEQVIKENGKIFCGEKVDVEGKFYIEPCIAVLPEQTGIMFKETFAPILFLTSYEGEIENGIKLINAPGNAGLVNAIYSNDKREIEIFAKENLSGHTIINSPKGTGTPAHGQGFGGNKDSGEGVILSPNPLAPFYKNNKVILEAIFKPSEPKQLADGTTAWKVKHEDGSISRVISHPAKTT